MDALTLRTIVDKVIITSCTRTEIRLCTLYQGGLEHLLQPRLFRCYHTAVRLEDVRYALRLQRSKAQHPCMGVVARHDHYIISPFLQKRQYAPVHLLLVKVSLVETMQLERLGVVIVPVEVQVRRPSCFYHDSQVAQFAQFPIEVYSVGRRQIGDK